MRCFLRWAFNGAAALSAVLCLAACVLWVRSYQVSDSLYSSHWWLRGLTGNESAWWLLTGRGGVGVGHRVQAALESPLQISAFTPLVDHPEYSWKREQPATPLYSEDGEGAIRRLGFRYEDDPMSPAFSNVSGYYREWDAPIWLVCLLFAVLPVRQLLAARKRKRSIGQGRCAKCGYDLRATPDRCPECGAVPALPTVEGTQ